MLYDSDNLDKRTAGSRLPTPVSGDEDPSREGGEDSGGFPIDVSQTASNDGDAQIDDPIAGPADEGG